MFLLLLFFFIFVITLTKILTSYVVFTVVEKRITTLESLVNETRILQEETKVFLKKLEDRQKCYLECNPNIEFNACFED